MELEFGYLNRDDLSQERFINDPFVANSKMYNTGDIAKFTPNGDVIYIGRSDFQVKINGLRIELGEIEKQISNFEDISNTAVVVKNDTTGRNILCAYFTADKKISLNKLKDFLRKKVPEYMIPVYFKQLNNFKYTPNGKIDRKLLPNPEFIKNNDEIVAPETPTEKLVTKIVENILTINPISITDNLFDIGADSLTALRLQIELLNENINIPYSDIFKYNTIKELSLRIDSNTKTEVTLHDNSYDYTAINNLISKNNSTTLDNINYNEIGNVILTGSTGFLGAHILSELIDNHNVTVFCLIRKNPGGITISDKLKERLNFYFGNKYDNEFGKRIIPIESDICDEELKLSKTNYNLLKNNSTCIINSAANVKHYGYYSDFEKINVNGVKNLIKFALDTNKKFIQISTTSVSGNTLVGEGSKLNTFKSIINYTEQLFFVGQSFENVYTYSKFEAEKTVFENILKNNLDGLVLRVGYITSRYSDGVFQINKLENALYNRIQTFIKIGCIPESLKAFPVEFTPVDYLAKAIVKSIEYYNKSINVLHLYNPNHIIMEDLTHAISQKSSIISDEDFKKLIKQNLKDPNKRNIIASIINDMDADFNLIYSSDIRLNNDFSVNFLKKAGFNWPIINEKYIKLLLYLFDL
jgi:thioester reductase-like protein